MQKVFVTTAVAAVVLTGCAPTMTTRTSSYGSSSTTTSRIMSPTLEAEPVDPYSTTGTWLVPEEIAPGTYRVNLSPGQDHGYGAVCGDYECSPFGEPGMLSNDNYFGPGVMVIPESAVSVELKRITLTPMVAGR